MKYALENIRLFLLLHVKLIIKIKNNQKNKKNIYFFKKLNFTVDKNPFINFK